ncbi:LacI family DNA-binding transcriptional regulator [Falsiroseomonas sp.]|uniref:LacI family DNA-binding transcriptional regulator n=1 Tax=Falsiroseomonas sp. TaxID=2870721 RepID=UPI0035638B6C
MIARIGIQEVAEAAGVSVATVSRALNTPGRVTPALRARVTEAARRLGYLGNGAARALASRRSGAMGALVPTLDNPVFAACIDAFQQRLDAHGTSLLVATAGYDAAAETRGLRTLLQRGVDGILLVGAAHEPETWALLPPGLPAVVTWMHRAEGCALPCIGFDNQAAAARMTRHLVELGHRRIAMIAGQSRGNDRAAARIAGVRQALAEAGLSLSPPLLAERAYTVADGRAAMEALLTLPDPPSAVVCGNDHLAFGALVAARRAGLAVPDDISVTGFDDLDFLAHGEPPLTTVHVPAAEMGRRAADHLVALAAGQTPPPPAELEAPVVLRGTTAPPAHRQPGAAAKGARGA